MMANGLDVCHGGVVFALADTAMAFMSNARGNQLASNASINGSTGTVGDRLVAETDIHHQGRTGVYGVVVSGLEGGVVFTARRSASRTKDRPP